MIKKFTSHIVHFYDIIHKYQKLTVDTLRFFILKIIFEITRIAILIVLYLIDT